MAEPAIKKLKLELGDGKYEFVTTESPPEDLVQSEEKENLKDEADEIEQFKETDVGILAFISDLPGFQGIIKQRFSDFIVNEISEKGEVVHLTSTPSKTKPEDENIAEDKASTEEEKAEEVKPISPVKCSQLPEADVDSLNQLLNSTDKSQRVVLQAGDEKEERCRIHRAIRMFPTLESTTMEVDGQKVIQVKKMPPPKKDKGKGGTYGQGHHRQGRKKWSSDQGDYCRFILYKENKDTMDALFKLSHMLHVNKGLFQYGGTKDRRAKTCQEVTAYRLRIERLEAVSPILWNMKLGGFRYVDKPLRLGQIKGNKFSIVVRSVTGSDEGIDKAMKSLKDNGFINYFGMQRFGTTSIPTYHIGRAILNNEWEQVVELIMKPRPREYGMIAECRQKWWETRDCGTALRTYPKRYAIERTLLMGLRKDPKNYAGAFGMIPRNTRLMYLHSYQSYLWNCAVTRRIHQFGMRPVMGDLVLSPQTTDGEQGVDREAEDDDEENNTKKFCLQSIVLDKTNIKNYTIYDVVMPLPGFDVMFPEHAAKDWYEELLQEDQLTTESFRHKNKQYALRGTYRKVLIKPEDVSWQTYMYDDLTQPLILSDMDRLEGLPEPQSIEGGSLKALTLEMTLPPACYATMALREVLKVDTSSAHQSTLNSS